MFGLSPMKLLILVGAIYLLYKMFSNDKKYKKKNVGGNQQQTAENMAASGDMVKDPICGAFVSKDGDIRVRNGGEIIHFCSYDCRDKYVRRLQAGTTQTASTESSESNTAS